jgi:nudix-type nucleoside diphosphatase (YffH/AdpP family)
LPFEITDRRIVYQGFTRLEVLDIAQVSRAGVTMHMKREIETHGNGAAVLAYDAGLRTAILVRQLRVPVGLSLPDAAHLLEVIAGLIDHAADDAAATAKREAMEEAGLRLGELTEVAAPFSSPGVSTERLALFLAEIDIATARVETGGGLAEEHEDIEVVDIPLKTLANMADQGEILDLKTFALVQTLRLRRPDLFLD